MQGGTPRAGLRSGLMRRLRRLSPLALLLWPALAQAEPSLDDILAKARVVAAKRPTNTSCNVRIETTLLDKAGKVEHQEQRDAKVTLHGDEQDFEAVHVVRDGKAMSAEELADENKKARKHRGKKSDDMELSPLDAKNAASEKFTLLRQETLWGRPAWVVKVEATGQGATLASGTLWLDAERFVELKGELSPAQTPAHADWVKVQEQFRLDGNGVPLPTFIDVAGAGHMMFIHKQFRSALRFSDCK